MKAWRPGVLLAAMALALASFSAAAAAKPGYSVFPAFHESSASLKGTNGFTISIAHYPGRVELSASKGDAVAIYIVRTEKTAPDAIEAQFPGMGRVSLRFHPSGPAQREQMFCKRRLGSIKQPGTFRGVIRFRGERSFTQVAARQAPGFFLRSFKEACRRSEDDSSPEPPGYSLSASGKSHGRQVLFGASRSTEGSVFGSKTRFIAQELERRRGMTIARIVFKEASQKAFAVEGPPARPNYATVTPPPPFGGTAIFDATAGGSPSWSGTLTVDFPGAEQVALAGSSFTSKLCLDLCTEDLGK